jgi:Tfp pilus assembly protein PilO
MPKTFNWTASRDSGRFWLQTVAIALAVANAAALFLYLDPPGGSRAQLVTEQLQVRREVNAARARAARLKTVSDKVQLGSAESSAFERKYFLPKRSAYQEVMAEIQRMASASGLQQREAAFTEEPIEGAPDLQLLNVVTAFQGTYDNLMHFFYEADRSPMLLMIDAVQAAPQQHSPQISMTVRFQAILQDPAASSGGLP